MTQRIEFPQSGGESEVTHNRRETSRRCLEDISQGVHGDLATYIKERLHNSGNKPSCLPEYSIGPDIRYPLHAVNHNDSSPKSAVLANGDKLTIDSASGTNGKMPWHLEDKNGKQVTIKPQLTHELRQPQWFELSNGAIYTPAHRASDTLLDHIKEQANNTITYPDGSQVEFNNQGIVSTRARKSK